MLFLRVWPDTRADPLPQFWRVGFGEKPVPLACVTAVPYHQYYKCNLCSILTGIRWLSVYQDRRHE